MFDQDRISPLCPYNIKQESNWNNEKYLLGDYSVILNIGGKFLKKLWYCVSGRVCHSDGGLLLEMSAF